MADITSTQSGLWSAGGTWVGGAAPADGDKAIIAAGHEVQVDVDQSAWTGMLGMSVTGGATPGMVYWKDGQSGTLKLRTGADIVGTFSTNNGRILANSDGSWATTTNLVSTTDAIIMLEGTATLDCDTLDIRMRCANPTNQRVRTYGTKYDFDGATAVDPATDIIDLGVSPPSADTKVMVTTAAGVLPTGLLADTMYYVRSVSGNTCKLATWSNDDSIVDITADGSGTCTLYTGYASGSATVNVLDDVTADLWATNDAVVLANNGPQNYDQQRLTLSTINAGTIVLSAVVDSAQHSGSSIYLSTRNCSILHSTTSTSQNIIEDGDSCIFGEIRATAGTGTTFYGYGLYSGSGHTATTITGCNNGIHYGSGHTATTIAGCSIGLYSGSGHTATTITGCSVFGILYGSGHTVTTITGCTNGLYSGSGHTATTIAGCNNGIHSGSGHTATTITGCSVGIYYGSGHTATTITGCSVGIYYGSGHTVTTITGCSVGIRAGSYNFVRNLSGNSTDLYETGSVYSRDGIIPATPSLNDVNTLGAMSKLFSDHHAGVFDAYRIFQCMGNTTKVTAGDGSPTPDQRSGGCTENIELSNLQSNLSDDPKGLWAWDTDAVKIWATADAAKTYRFYIQSTFALTAAAELVLRAEYLDDAGDTGMATIDSDETITARSGITDWSQYIEVSVTPVRTGWIFFNIKLYKYDSGGQVFIDPLLVIS